jgi:hypothetical protein
MPGVDSEDVCVDLYFFVSLCIPCLFPSNQQEDEAIELFTQVPSSQGTNRRSRSRSMEAKLEHASSETKYNRAPTAYPPREKEMKESKSAKQIPSRRVSSSDPRASKLPQSMLLRMAGCDFNIFLSYDQEAQIWIMTDREMKIDYR